MTSRRERLVTIGALDPAPAGHGFGMVHLRPVHHIDAPPKTRHGFWHVFASRDELREFLCACRRSGAGTTEPGAILAMRTEPGPGTIDSDVFGPASPDAAPAPRTIWSALTHRHSGLLKRLTHHYAHKEPPRRSQARH